MWQCKTKVDIYIYIPGVNRTPEEEDTNSRNEEFMNGQMDN